MTTKKGDNWNIAGILRKDMLYDYDTKQFFKFYPDNAFIEGIDATSNSVIIKIPEKNPPIDMIINMATNSLQGIINEAEDSLKIIKYELILYPDNDYTFNNEEFTIEQASRLFSHINQYVNTIPESSLEEYAYDVYYKCWPKQRPYTGW
jgi:hypothetical protein